MNTHPSDFVPTGLLTVPTSPIIPSLPVMAGLLLRLRKEPKMPKSTPPMNIETTTTAPSKTPEYGTPAPKSAKPPASSATIAPAVGRPWLVTCRSTRNSASPIRTRISPIAGGIAIIGKVSSVRPVGMLVTVASSLRSDCIAPLLAIDAMAPACVLAGERKPAAVGADDTSAYLRRLLLAGTGGRGAAIGQSPASD